MSKFNNEVFPLDERRRCFQLNTPIEIDNYIIKIGFLYIFLSKIVLVSSDISNYANYEM